jgi:hypothetical protein
LLNGEGKVAMVNVGFDEEMPKALLKEIRKVLGEPVDDPVPEPLANFLDGHGSGGEGQQAVAAAQGAAKKSGDGPAGEGHGTDEETADAADQQPAKTRGKRRGKRKKKGRRKKR